MIRALVTQREEINQYGDTVDTPIIDICRAMPSLNCYFGGKISKLSFLFVSRPIGKNHKVVILDKINHVRRSSRIL